jgi:MFS family permease
VILINSIVLCLPAGKFKTILYLSLVYCLGSVILSITAIPGVTGTPPHWWGAVLALLILAVGTGGIKSSVSAFVGDQFRPDQAVALSVAFSMFYFMINAGSLISTILTPILRAQSYALAFGVPAILLLIATGIFFVGRHQYVKVRFLCSLLLPEMKTQPISRINANSCPRDKTSLELRIELLSLPGERSVESEKHKSETRQSPTRTIRFWTTPNPKLARK